MNVLHLFYFILFLIFFVILCVYIKFAIWTSYIKNLPSPPGRFLTGHVHLVLDVENALKTNLALCSKVGGNTCRVYVGPMPVILTSDPKLLEVILTNPKLTAKSKEYKFFKDWLGDGLLFSSGEKWRRHRKIITPAFHYNILEDHIEIFQENSKQLVTNFEKSVGKSVDIYTMVSKFALDVICETSMGIKINAQTSDDCKYFNAVKKLCVICLTRGFTLFSRFDFTYKYTKMAKEEKELIAYTKELSRNIITSRRKQLEENITAQNNETDEFGLRKKSNFVDILLGSTSDGIGLTDDEIREEVDTFLFEGHDTTSISLSMIIYYLGNYPEVQEKVYKEVVDVMSNLENEKLTTKDLNEMKYLDMVIKESIRLAPAVPVTAREILQDFQFENFTLKKGMTLAVNIYYLHRNKEFFPDPDKFDPERFSLENSMGRNPYTYLPFSAGFRNCIGQKFAMLEMKCALSKIVTNFEILPADPYFDPKLVPSVTLTSWNGIKVGLKKRRTQ